jgi:hypothetical protein
MYVIPRTPVSPTRKALSPTRKALSPIRTAENLPVKDVYDQFIDIYFSVDIKIQVVLLDRIIKFVGHPAYSHLLRTMDANNAHHVMGYLRSQRSVEMYVILDQIIRNPLPTKIEFYKTINGI